MRVHEAEAVVEEHLRRCRGTLWVVHGVGTGRLKRGLRSWLEGLNYVDKVCDANQDEGGPGCSVVWLR
jgi:DNA mismatch repair protein MutS2